MYWLFTRVGFIALTLEELRLHTQELLQRNVSTDKRDGFSPGLFNTGFKYPYLHTT